MSGNNGGEISLARRCCNHLLSLSLSLSIPLPSNNQPNPPSSDSFTDLQKLFLIKDSPCQLALTHRTFLIKERTISPLPSSFHPFVILVLVGKRGKEGNEARRNETRIVSRGKNRTGNGRRRKGFLRSVASERIEPD